MRAALLIPASCRPLPADAVAASPDLVLLDAEGSWPMAGLIRETRSALPGALVFVRIRPLALDGQEELEAALEGEPSGIWLSEAVGRRAVEQLGSRIAVGEARLGIADGATRIVAAIETAAGALAIKSLAEAGSRLAGISYDGAPIAREVGCEPDAEPVRGARAYLLLAAAAARIPAIDATADLDAFAAHASRANRDGFSAKLALDLGQLAVLKRIGAQAPLGRWIENFVSGVATK